MNIICIFILLERCEKIYRWFLKIASDFEEWFDNNVKFAKMDLDMFENPTERAYLKELLGEDILNSNPNVVCWLPGGTIKRRYMHTFDRYKKLRRFISWTASGRGFSLSNYTSWFNPVKRNYFWLPQDNMVTKWVAWPYNETRDLSEHLPNNLEKIGWEPGNWLVTVHPQHIVTGPRTTQTRWFGQDEWYYTQATTFFPVMIYPWSYYNTEDHTVAEANWLKKKK